MFQMVRYRLSDPRSPFTNGFEARLLSTAVCESVMHSTLSSKKYKVVTWKTCNLCVECMTHLRTAAIYNLIGTESPVPETYGFTLYIHSITSLIVECKVMNRCSLCCLQSASSGITGHRTRNQRRCRINKNYDTSPFQVILPIPTRYRLIPSINALWSDHSLSGLITNTINKNVF